jgi:hypothetical protein
MRPAEQQDGADKGIDPVEEAAEESFPASAPSHLDAADGRQAPGVVPDVRIAR